MTNKIYRYQDRKFYILLKFIFNDIKLITSLNRINKSDKLYDQAVQGRFNIKLMNNNIKNIKIVRFRLESILNYSVNLIIFDLI